MKKFLTVLLTLVMALCLFNINNNHTKAEDANTDYSYNYERINPTTTNWDTSFLPSYNAGDKVSFTNNDTASTPDVVHLFYDGKQDDIYYTDTSSYRFDFEGGSMSTGGNIYDVNITDTADYTYTFGYDGAAGKFKWFNDELSSYNAGTKVRIKSDSSGSYVDVYVNGSKVTELDESKYGHTIKNNGAKITLSVSGDRGIVNINDGNKPTPSPSEPVVKDESCEKVIGPTWHWNESKGICEEYSTVGTSTR